MSTTGATGITRGRMSSTGANVHSIPKTNHGMNVQSTTKPRATTRCRITDIQLATAQIAWRTSLQLPAITGAIRALEDREMKQAGKKKATRRAKALDLLTFRNAIVQATIRSHERFLDTRSFLVRAALPSQDNETTVLTFVNNEFDIHRSSTAVIEGGLCQVLSGRLGEDPTHDAFEDLMWSMRPVVHGTKGWNATRVSVCGFDNKSRYEGSNDYLVKVWFDRGVSEEPFDALAEHPASTQLVQVNDQVRAVVHSLWEPPLIISVNSRYNDPHRFWHSYKIDSNDIAVIDRASKLAAQAAHHVNNMSPKAVVRLFSELGYCPLIDTP